LFLGVEEVHGGVVHRVLRIVLIGVGLAVDVGVVVEEI